MHARDRFLRGKPLNGKKPRCPKGQKNNTSLIAWLHTQISHTIALFSLSLSFSNPFLMG